MKIRNKEYDLTKIIFNVIFLGSLAVIIVTLAIFSEKGSQPWMVPTGIIAFLIAISIGLVWALKKRNERVRFKQ